MFWIKECFFLNKPLFIVLIFNKILFCVQKFTSLVLSKTSLTLLINWRVLLFCSCDVNLIGTYDWKQVSQVCQNASGAYVYSNNKIKTVFRFFSVHDHFFACFGNTFNTFFWILKQHAIKWSTWFRTRSADLADLTSSRVIFSLLVRAVLLSAWCA